jgi:hypothetical protein
MIKECKSCLNPGGCQARDFDSQIADDTLAFIICTVLALDKYETLGEIFRQRAEELFELTLWRRILPIIRKLLETLAEITGLTPDEMMEAMLENKETAKAYAIIMDALSTEKELRQMTA